MEELGHVPSRVELFSNMDSNVYEYCVSHSKDNIFKNYMNFLNEENLLSSEEKLLFDSFALDFLHEVETTSMTKIYKMPVLSAFYNKDTSSMRLSLTEEDLLTSWKEFFRTNCNWKDLPNITSYEEYQKITDKAHLTNILKNPVNFLIKSGKGLFKSSSTYPIELKEELSEFLSNECFISQFLDIINYRSLDYYKRRYISEK